MNPNEELQPPIGFGENFQHSVSYPIFNNTHPKPSMDAFIDRPSKHIKTDSLFSFSNTNHANNMKPKDEVLSPHSLTFPSDSGSFGNQNYVFKPCNETKRIISQSTQDHIMAERKRREKLSQRFIALSAIVPGLKKMDKASVLSDAITYLKQLQEQVSLLEEKTRKKPMESVVYVKRIKLTTDDEHSYLNESISDESLPEIEARFSEKDILIKIHCDKTKGVAEKILNEVEKLHITVVNSSVMTFGNCSLDVTIIAQMDAEFSMTAKDVVKNLHAAFKIFM